MRNIYILLLTLSASLHPSQLWAQWSNYVKNINLFELGGGTHTWDIKGSDNGWIYIANNDGMFEYNSGRWSRYTPKEGVDLRSTLPDDDREQIYISGVGEFGYYEMDESGAMHYTSLISEFTKQHPDVRLDNIWSIEIVDNILYLQEDNCIIKYVGELFTIIELDSKINAMAQVDGILYLGTEGGLYMIIGNRAVKCRGSEMLDNKTIREILPLDGAVGVVTHSDIYVYNPETEQVTLYDIGLSEFLRDNIAFCGAVSDDRLAIGTIRGGVVIYNTATGQLTHQDMQSGLQSNTVLSLYFDNDRLWVGQDGGVDYIMLDSDFLTFNDSSIMLGSGYSSYLDGDNLYLGSNKGLYLQRGKQRAESVVGAKGQVWRLERVWGDLFSLQDQGLFVVEGERATNIDGIRSALNIVEVANREGFAIVGSYDALYLIRRVDGEWRIEHQIEGSSRYPKTLIQSDDGVLWLYDTNVIFRLELDSELRRVVSEDVIALPNEQKIASFDMVGGELLFSDHEGNVYRIDRESNISTLVTSLGRRLFSIKESGDKRFYLHSDQIISVDRDSVVRSINLPITINQRSEGIRFINDSMAILPHLRGFILVNPNGYATPQRANRETIRSIRSTVPSDSLLYRANFIGQKAELELPHSMNSIRIESSLPEEHGATFQYRLSDRDEWSEPTHFAFKEYGNISAGEYNVSVRITHRDGEADEESIELSVMPPWYLSGIAYAIYALLIIGIITLARALALKKRKHREALLVADKEAQIHSLERDMIEQQLRQKSQEMANLLVGAANRNQLFSQIKEELGVVRSAIGRQPNESIIEMIISMNSKLDSNITSEEILRRIESEFDIAHDNFMRDLTAKHPNLNHNERMMCAYLRIGLSSKEIAPLLNISTRGVETLRYRIRKKFNLQREDSLSGYILNC